MKPGALDKGIILPGERRMKGGRSLNGGIWLDIDGKGRIELSPDQAIQLATGILRNLGMAVEFDTPQ
jgi:hypothetical protein